MPAHDDVDPIEKLRKLARSGEVEPPPTDDVEDDLSESGRAHDVERLPSDLEAPE